MLQAIIHYSLHFIAPALLAYVFFGRERFWSAYGVMLLSMAVDLDHLLANPIFDPHRMSIGFHPLHSYPAIAVYVLFCLIPKNICLPVVGERTSYCSSIPYDNGLSRLYALDKVENIFQEKTCTFQK